MLSLNIDNIKQNHSETYEPLTFSIIKIKTTFLKWATHKFLGFHATLLIGRMNSSVKTKTDI